LTVIGAMTTQSILAAMTVKSATDREVFLTYLDEVLCPKLKPGDWVLMHNHSTHLMDGYASRSRLCKRN
jgi:hydrogenase maturation factor